MGNAESMNLFYGDKNLHTYMPILFVYNEKITRKKTSNINHWYSSDNSLQSTQKKMMVQNLIFALLFIVLFTYYTPEPNTI